MTQSQLYSDVLHVAAGSTRDGHLLSSLPASPPLPNKYVHTLAQNQTACNFFLLTADGMFSFLKFVCSTLASTVTWSSRVPSCLFIASRTINYYQIFSNGRETHTTRTGHGYKGRTTQHYITGNVTSFLEEKLGNANSKRHVFETELPVALQTTSSSRTP